MYTSPYRRTNWDIGRAKQFGKGARHRRALFEDIIIIIIIIMNEYN